MRRGRALSRLLAGLLAAAPGAGAAGAGRERALEQIPELMGRILDAQEEIRTREEEMAPVVAGHDAELAAARRGIEDAAGERDAADALVGYVEAYAARLEAQAEGLRSMERAVTRMRADARELLRAAEELRVPGERADASPALLEDQFQGVAMATSELAARLGREEEAAATGAVLHASWASRGSLDLPLPALGPEGALAFARRADALTARYQARVNQLRSERRALRGLLDLLIQRQLGGRLDALFAEGPAEGPATLVASGGASPDWQELASAVGRALDLPDAAGPAFGDAASSLERLERFARGEHRD
jgi:hypothetical protein